MNIKALKQTPSFDAVAILSVEALAPLSMVVQMPGKYYRSQREPSREMLFGLLENALGWHLGEKDRTRALSYLEKQHATLGCPYESGSGFKSLLQFHVHIGIAMTDAPSSMFHYDDYWSQHLRTNGQEFIGGSREYDRRAIPAMDASARRDDDPTKLRFSEKVSVEVTARDADRNPMKDGHGKSVKRTVPVRRDAEAISNFAEDDVLHPSVLRPFFPRYYISPTPREYVIPRTPFRFRVETSPDMETLISEAIEDPAAPLYLGSSDGWVDVSWQRIAGTAT